MKNLLKKACLLIVIAFIPACKKLGLCHDEPLQIKKTDYAGNALKIKGFYYCRRANSTVVQYLILYRNGVLVSGFVEEEGQLEPYMQQLYQNPDFLKNRIGWGAFTVESNSLLFEEIAVHICANAVVRHEAIIINDTTFTIQQSINRFGREETVYNVQDTFHFRSYAPKPDSTNQYVH